MENNQYIKKDEHYNLLYIKNLEQEAKWLSLGASQKVDSIEQLIKRANIKPHSILELGCGTGAVIKECQRRKLAMMYYGVDNSPNAVEYLKQNSNNISLKVADITKEQTYKNKQFDLILLIHVLEHIENDTHFLTLLLKNVGFDYIIIEVPLEDLLIARLKSIFWNRKKNKAGHVNFYNTTSFYKLISSIGLDILETRKYAPVLNKKVLDYINEKNKRGKINRFLKKMTSYYLPLKFENYWIRFYYAHCTVLCKKKNR